MKKIALILSGCGVYDGAEIHETVCSMLSLSKHGLSYELFAPDEKQYHVVNHLTGEVSEEERNVLVESARIARGKVSSIVDLDPDDYDGLFFPGGFGVAKNLSSYAFEGAGMTVNPLVEELIIAFHGQGKPIVALCVAPMLLAKVISGVKVTLGNDSATVEAVHALGASHVDTTHGQICVDEKNKLITSPCYMLDADISDIFAGTEAAVSHLILLGEQA